jgi:acyl-CoA synthetase (AMP-forming)/AMP-acid ligase II
VSRERELADALRLAPPALRALVRAGALRPLPPARLRQAARAARTLGMGAAGGVAISAARDPEGIAIHDERGSISFAQLDARAARIAAGLRAEQGVGPGRALGVMCRNHRGFVEAMLTASRLGADLLLLNTDFPGPQLAQALAGQGIGAIVHDEEFAAVLDLAGYDGERVLAWQDAAAPAGGAAAGRARDSVADRPPRSARPPAGDAPGAASAASARALTLDALADLGAPPPPPPASPGRLVILSSGTTGPPKGAPREPSASAALGPLTTLLEQLRPRAGDPILIGPPAFHGFGLAFLGMALFIGAPVVLRRRFDAATALDDIARHRVTHMVGVPVMLQRILDVHRADPARHDVSSLRAVGSAAAPLAPQLAHDFMDAFGELLFNLYGSTETGFASIAGPADLRAAPGTVGRAPRGITLAVLDEQRRSAAPGVTGHVFVGSGLVFDGYSGGGSREVVGGLMSTGDLGHLDAAGRLFIDGREDDMIVSGGENVFPQEVADALIAHPAVADAACVGVPDEQFGQRLRAYVVAADGAAPSPDDLLAHLRATIARYKLPREIQLIDEIPRNPTGKVQRSRLPEA